MRVALPVRAGPVMISAWSSRARPYAVPLAELESSAHVPLDQQVQAQPEAPAEPPIAPEDLDRARLLGPTGAGRLRLR